MKKCTRSCLICAGIFLFLFLLLTFLVMKVDVQSIGPNGSTVGLATINGTAFQYFGSNPIWYTISEALGVVALLIVAGCGCLGIWQWISRKSLRKVDKPLFFLAGLYAVTLFFYAFFEVVIINYRPVPVDGVLEASYPSSHTMLVCVILLSAFFYLKSRIQSRPLRVFLFVGACAIVVCTALGRLLAGVHWCTDVIAAILLSGVLVCTYQGLVRQFCSK